MAFHSIVFRNTPVSHETETEIPAWGECESWDGEWKKQQDKNNRAQYDAEY